MNRDSVTSYPAEIKEKDLVGEGKNNYDRYQLA